MKYGMLAAIMVLLSQFAHAFATKAPNAILIDTYDHTVLYAKNAQDIMVPSSMTKLMTAYVVFEHLDKGIISLDDEFMVSKRAWKKSGSKMFVRHRDKVSIRDLLQGIIVQSGNDACIVLAEGIAASEEEFANLMNKTAKRIGLKHSHFKNSTGWPDEGHVMSARDIAHLAYRIITDFPQYYEMFKQKSFTYSNIKQNNRNSLIGGKFNIDGLKTGHTQKGGYGIVISGQLDDRRIISVVNGLDSAQSRLSEAERLLAYGFRYFERKTLFKKGQSLNIATVTLGEQEEVSLVPSDDISLLVPKLEENAVSHTVNVNNEITAPISKGQELGTVTITVPELGTYEFALVAADDVLEANFFKKITDKAKSLFEF